MDPYYATYARQLIERQKQNYIAQHVPRSPIQIHTLPQPPAPFRKQSKCLLKVIKNQECIMCLLLKNVFVS